MADPTPISSLLRVAGQAAVVPNGSISQDVSQAINSALGIVNNKSIIPSFDATKTDALRGLTPAANNSSEFRAKLDALNPEDVYKNKSGLLSPLNATGGIIFPYSPTITFNQTVNYTDLQLVHSNMDYPAYTRTPTCTLSVSGKFTVQNAGEGKYALAVIHFLRAVSKSHFGETDPQAGLPPPILVFSAYGPYIYNRLRCVLKSHSWGYDDTVDTIPVTVAESGLAGGTVRLPAMFTITMELMVVQTPYNMRRTFNFDKFASGALLDADGGYV